MFIICGWLPLSCVNLITKFKMVTDSFPLMTQIVHTVGCYELAVRSEEINACCFFMVGFIIAFMASFM